MPTEPARPTRRLDPIAFVALGGALLACCPFAAVIGIIAGTLSLSRIRRSNGMLGGRRIAAAAIGASVIMGTVSWVAGDRLQTQGQASMQQDVRRAVDQFLTGSVEPSAWWTEVDPRELLEFQQKVRARLGTLTTASVTQTEVRLSMQSIGKSAGAFRLLLESTTIQTVASVSVEIVTDFQTLRPSVLIRSLSIQLPSGTTADGGDETLSFPRTIATSDPDSLSTP